VYLTVQEIADELRIPKRSAYELIKREMVHVRAGRHIRITRASFVSWKRNTQRGTCESFGNESDLTEAAPQPTGRTSLAAESRQDARRFDSLARGKKRSSSTEPIHVSRPRRERA
jgi:excisionase family DNA binding protein